MDRVRQRLRLETIAVFLTMGCLAFGCDSSDPEPGGPGGDTDAGALDPGSAIQRNGDSFSYRAEFRITDTVGRPLPGAQVSLGTETATTDADGVATLEGLPAQEDGLVRVTRDGNVPRWHISRPDLTAQGRNGQQELRLAERNQPERLRHVEGGSSGDGHSRLQLPPDAFLRRDGSPLPDDAEVDVEITTLRDGQYGGSPHSVGPDGRERPLAIRGGVYLFANTPDGSDAQLAPGVAATVDIEVGPQVPLGSELSLATLNEETGGYETEGKCTVVEVGSRGSGARACRGQIRHFSVHVAAEELGDGTRCVAFRSGWTSRSQYLSATALRCDDSRCESLWATLLSADPSPEAFWGGGVFVHPSDQATHVLYVELTEAASDAPTDDEAERPLFSEVARRFHSIALSDAGTFQDGTCSLQLELPETFRGSDADGDANLLDFDLPPVLGPDLWLGKDCDDDNPLVGASQPEVPCDELDNDCNPATPDGGRYTDFLDYWIFNGLCSESCIESEDAEVPGNAFDEDCDGMVTDADGDGFEHPADCDDLNPDASPGGSEVAGNRIDEDCDGVYLDFDGDGHLAPHHRWQVDPAVLGDLPLDDCNDAAPRIHGGADLSAEAGQLARLFDGETRGEAYCGYFQMDGTADLRFSGQIRDYNCDGLLTDLDGDGWAAPGDDSLGPDRAFDCDDADPRVVPQGTPPDVVCEPLTNPDNQSECSAHPAGQPDRCPVLFGGVRHGLCSDALNQDGSDTGIDLCNFVGWDSTQPLVAEPGVLWGPCDGEMRGLTDCQDGTQCGLIRGGFSQQLRDYLLSEFGMVAETTTEGMCFPLCDRTL